MNNSKEEIDKIIHQALSKEEAEFYDQLGEKSLIGTAFDVYTGRDKWLKIIMAIVTLASFIGFVYCAVQFFNTEVTNEMIKWLGIGILFFGISMSLKIWQWMEMSKNSVIRELRRVEFQLTILAKHSAKK